MSQSLTAASLNAKLPINITAEDVESNPEFAKLLAVLADNYITPSGLYVQQQEELQQKQALLDKEKQVYFQNLILLSELRELLDDHRLALTSCGNKSKSPEQIYQRAEHILLVTEAAQNLDISSTTTAAVAAQSGRTSPSLISSRYNNNSNSNGGIIGSGSGDDDINNNSNANDGATHLLGVSKQFLQESQLKDLTSSANLRALQLEIIPQIEDRLRRKCDALADFYEPHSTEHENLTAKSLQLPRRIAEKRAEIEHNKQRLKVELQNYESAFWFYFKILSKSLDMLTDLLQEYKLKYFVQLEAVKIKWLIERCRTMKLKLDVIKHTFLKETYYPEAVTALSKIREHLEKAFTDTSQEYLRIETKLQQYERVGAGFSKLVDEYTGILEDIKNKVFALDRLNKAKQR